MNHNPNQPVIYNRKLRDALAGLPDRWAGRMQKQFQGTQEKRGRWVAEIELEETIASIEGVKFDIASSNDDLTNFAKARADECFRAACRYVDKDEALAAMLAIALRYEIEAPFGRNVTPTGQRLRLLSYEWWRLKLRKVVARNVEAAAIKLGMVHRLAGLYASDESMKRRRGQRKRNAQILASIVASNDQGQEYTLAELAELGVSNPEMRRNELMTRIAGFDQLAVKLDHAANFHTITAPSKYHARHHVTGRKNKEYQGFTPTQTQRYLCRMWSRVRAKLHREKISYYGVRVAEPHHDGTPHWHMIVFSEKQDAQRISDIIRAYAMKEEGTERGADIHRYKVEEIDRKRGSAAAYLAKYISKNIDGKNAFGEGIGDDYEAVIGDDDATQTARRVDAWASTWGIRQFQQLGGQSVTVWRELRRADVSTIQNEDLKGVAAAADAGAWDRYTELAGGVMARHYEFPRFSKKSAKNLKNGHKAIRPRLVQLSKQGAIDVQTGEIRLNKFTELAAPLVVGFHGFGESVETHTIKWEFKRKSDAQMVDLQRVLKSEAPRSSVNNCTQKNKIFKSAVADLEKTPVYCLVNFNRKDDFLKGEELEEWKKQQLQGKKQPVKRTPNVWPPCSRVLSGSALIRQK